MTASERRKQIIRYLSIHNGPTSGSVLSVRFSVSRQIIVQDIAILKGQGYDILSTHSGYVLQSAPRCERVFKVLHTSAQTEDELNCIVDLGGMVLDVFVWHKVYGRICAPLNIASRVQVKQFLEGVRTGKSVELMNITGGYHYHTVRADSEQTLELIHEALMQREYIVPELFRNE